MTEPKLNEILTPASLRWGEFTDALEQSLKRHGCRGGHGERPLARRFMAAMGGVDVEGSLAYFSEHGGCCCDCEILINVEDCAELYAN
jgi:hypothetical protein